LAARGETSGERARSEAAGQLLAIRLFASMTQVGVSVFWFSVVVTSALTGIAPEGNPYRNFIIAQ
jgi:hypothetical protein